MNLYELNNAYIQALNSCIDSETGEITDLSALEELEIAKDEKVKNCALFILNAEAEISALDEQEKKFKERKKYLKNKVQRIKDYVANNIDKAYTFTEVKVFFKASEETVITDKEAFENYCKRHKELCTIKYEPNKSAIKQAIASGLKVKGAEIVKKQNLQIK